LKTKDFQAGHNGMGDSVVVTKIGQKREHFSPKFGDRKSINYGLRNTPKYRFRKKKEFITTGRTHSFIETVNNNVSAPAGKRVRRGAVRRTEWKTY